MYSKKCPKCGSNFSCASNIQTFCSIKCGRVRPKLVKQCKHCQSTFETHDRRQTFCNYSCAAIFNNKSRGPRTEDTKNKLARAAKLNPSGAILNNIKRKQNGIPNPPSQTRLAYEASPKLCCVCNDPIPFTKSWKIKRTCSKKECLSKVIGGLRKGSGRSKHGWYQGIHCDSLYELAFVIYQLDQGVTIKRSRIIIPYIDENGVERKYYPDFEINGVLYEIKGWMTERTKLKIAAAPKNMKVVAGKSDIAPFVKYACTKYQRGYDRLVEVYDSSSHLMEYECSQCGKHFIRAKSTKTSPVCSLVCSGKMAAKRLAKNRNARDKNRTCLIPERQSGVITR